MLGQSRLRQPLKSPLIMGVNLKSRQWLRALVITPKLFRQHSAITALPIFVSNYTYTLPDMYSHMTQGFISGKQKATISWTKLAKNPSAWMEDECYPPGFQWVDPSKIRKTDVFCLLDHWRQRKESGLPPIIWNPSCDTLADLERPHHYLRNTEPQQRHLTSHTSAEETFSRELDAIPEDGTESQHSSHPTPSSTPAQRTSRAIERPELRQISPDSGRLASDRACKYTLIFMCWKEITIRM